MSGVQQLSKLQSIFVLAVALRDPLFKTSFCVTDGSVTSVVVTLFLPSLSLPPSLSLSLYLSPSLSPLSLSPPPPSLNLSLCPDDTSEIWTVRRSNIVSWMVKGHHSVPPTPPPPHTHTHLSLSPLSVVVLCLKLNCYGLRSLSFKIKYLSFCVALHCTFLDTFVSS